MTILNSSKGCSVIAAPQHAGPTTHFFYVDLLRGFAAYAVVICHYRWFFARWPGDFRPDADLPLYSTLWPIYDYGGLAVQLFWVLSGFVFYVAYGSYGKHLSARTFWSNRFSRLYPLHFVTLLVVAFLQIVSLAIYGRSQVYSNNDALHFALQLLMASDWFPMGNSFNGPIWSVSVEVLIYLIFLIVVKRSTLNLRAALLLTVVGSILAHLTQSNILLCLALFFSGVTIGIVNPILVKHLSTQQLWGLMLISLLAVIVAAIGAHFFTNVKLRTVLIFLGSPMLLFTFITFDVAAKELPLCLRWIGASTYSVYLWHMPIVIAAKLAWGGSLPRFMLSPLSLCLFILLVGLLGTWSYQTIESPAQRWLRLVLKPPQGAKK